MTDLIEITTTLPSEDAALGIARHLVECRLVGCVQIAGPLTSVYRWNEKVQQEMEWRCTMKSLAFLQNRIIDEIKANHPYDVPEILILRVLAASSSYTEWLQQQVIQQQ